MGRYFVTPNKLSVQTGSPRLEIALFGDWDKAIRMLNGLGPKIKKSSIAAQLKVCKEIQRRVKAHIRAQDLGWAPLSETYGRRKREAGLGSKTLFAYGTYYNAIDVWQKGNQHFVYVGVKKGIYTRDLRGRRTKMDVATIAALHELGSGKKLPRRPLWNPTIKEIGGTRGIKSMYLKSLKYWLRIYGVKTVDLKRIF